MTTLAKGTMLPDEPSEQPQEEAPSLSSHYKETQTDAEQPLIIPEAGALIPMTDSDQGKSFAHDINFKIDELESQLSELNQMYDDSQGRLKHALGDVRSRTATMAEEINTVASQIARSDGHKNEWIKGLESRLRDAVSLLGDQLGGMDAQLESQHTSIRRLKQDLSDSYSQLENRINGLQQNTEARLDMLSMTQGEQNKTQQIFSDCLDDLQVKSNKTADDIFDLNTDVSAHKRETQSKYRLVIASFAACALVIVGAISYLHYSEVNVDKAIDNKLASMNASLAETYASKSESQESAQALESSRAQFNEQVNQLSVQSAQSVSILNDNLQQIADRVSALQLSVYGPADGKIALPAPKLTINDPAWLSARNPDHFGIQVVGVYREAAMIDFANRHNTALSEQPLAFNVSEYRGQQWYNLIYGEFVSFNDAQKALDELPGIIQKNAPWIRSMASIQKMAVN